MARRTDVESKIESGGQGGRASSAREERVKVGGKCLVLSSTFANFGGPPSRKYKVSKEGSLIFWPSHGRYDMQKLKVALGSISVCRAVGGPNESRLSGNRGFAPGTIN